jgi:tetratricopeptide (TPR) repeat protein
VGNVVAGALNYVVWSDGEFGQDLYREMASAGGVLAAVSLACAVFGFSMTAIAYLLSLDTGRHGRPRLRLYLLFASFCLFLAGYFLGAGKVPSDNLPAFAAALAAVLVIPLAVPFVEKAAGATLLRLAEAAYSSGAIANTLFLARLGLSLNPGNAKGEDTLGLALAEAGRIEQATPCLEESYARGNRDANLLRHLAQAHHDQQDFLGELAFVEHLHAVQPSSKLFERMIGLLEKTGNRRKALQEIEKLSGEEHRKWLPRQLDLCIELDEPGKVRELARQMEHEGPPFTHTRQAYRRLVASHPDDTESLEAVVELDSKSGAHTEAIANLEKLVHLHPDRAAYRRRLIAKYREANALDAANRHLEALLTLGQANIREKIEVLTSHFSLGDYARVESLFGSDDDLRRDPRAAYLLAATYFDTRRLEQAVEQVKAARLLDPDAETRSQLAVIEARSVAQINARELESLADRVAEQPDDLDLRFALCDKLVGSGTADKAVVEMEDLLQRRPDLKQRVLRELRAIQSQHGVNFRLLAYESDIHQRDANWDKVHGLVTEMAKMSLNPDQVLREGAERIVAAVPDHAPALRTLAETAHRASNHGQVLSALDRLEAAGAERSPENLQMRYDAVRALGRLDEAIELAPLLVALRPDDISLHLNLAQMRHDKGDFPGALASLDRARELDPENLELRRLSREYEEKRKRARLAHLTESLKSDPNRADLLEEGGDLHHDFGEFNEAIVAYQRAALDPDHHDVATAKLGYVLACKGMFTESQESFGEVKLATDQSPERQKKLKALFYSAAELMADEKHDDLALALYKRIFRVDAGYRDVVAKLEGLQRSDKSRK